MAIPYDPDKHCGAKTHSNGTPCTKVKGWRCNPPHPGVGRCYLHGGNTPTKKALEDLTDPVRSQIPRETFEARVQRAKADPELLSLDDNIAWLRVVLEDARKAISDNDGIIGEDSEGRPIRITAMDPGILEVMRLAQVMATSGFKMRFDKHFSITIQELEGIMGQIATMFLDLAKRYNIPAEASREFATKLRSVRLNKAPDPQLMRAGSTPDSEQGIVEVRSS